VSTHLRVLAATLLLSAVPGLVQAQVTSYAWVPSYNGKAFVIDNAALAPPVEVTVPGTPIGLAATPDGRYVWVATSSTTMPVFEVATRGLVDTVTLPYAAFTLTFTPDGSKAFVTSNGGNRLMIVDVATRTVIRTVNFGASVNPYAVASSPDGRTAYVTAVTSQKLYAVDVESGTFPTPADIGAACNGIAVSRDGATGFISCAANDRVLVQDLVSNTTIQPIAVGGFPYSVALSPDERWLYVANGATDSVSVIDVATRTVVKTVTVGDLPNNVAFTPDGRYALVNNQNAKTVTVLDVEGGHVVLPPDIPLAGASSILAFFNAGFITPAIIVPSGTPLTVAGDAGLAQQGFHQFVTFNGGTLRLAGEWTTSRHLSLLADGGTIDTNGFDAFISGDVINDGILTKIGAGTLTLSGDHKHASTTLAGGTLIVGGSHPMDLTIASGTLGGEGTMGEIVALTGDGVIAPAAGTNTTTGILRATRVYMSGDVSFVVDLTGPTAGVDCDRVEASDFAAINTSTLVISPSSALPIGSSCTILTNATGTFAGLAEGAMLIAGARVYRISYIGGDGNDVTLTAMTTAPTLTPIAPQTVPANTALPAVTFAVADAETEAGLLNVTASSSNQALVPNANLTLGGSGAARTIAAMPAAAARGEATITITVSDGVASASTDFTLTVTEASAYYLAEGATGSFFDTDILIANPNGSPAPVVITFLKEDGTTIVRNRTLPATSRATIHADEIEGLSGGAAFSTTVTSTNDLPLIVERTMWWDDRGYGTHTEKATTGAAPVWYFAEGAQGFFSTYFLLANPHDTENTVIARYFREGAGDTTPS
jgi:YVTN family beta-propeller protein/autotransporter-associated beta strand protein